MNTAESLLPQGAGIPSEARRRAGRVACIECRQEIPCNPCEQACPRGAIAVGEPITSLPRLAEARCNGCGSCVSRCPGQAIFLVDESLAGEMAEVTFPYEYLPLPEAGQEATLTDRLGRPVVRGVVAAVRQAPAFDHTALVTVRLPRAYAMTVRGLDRASLGGTKHDE